MALLGLVLFVQGMVAASASAGGVRPATSQQGDVCGDNNDDQALRVAKANGGDEPECPTETPGCDNQGNDQAHRVATVNGGDESECPSATPSESAGPDDDCDDNNEVTVNRIGTVHDDEVCPTISVGPVSGSPTVTPSATVSVSPTASATPTASASASASASATDSTSASATSTPSATVSVQATQASASTSISPSVLGVKIVKDPGTLPVTGGWLPPLATVASGLLLLVLGWLLFNSARARGVHQR